VILQIDVTVTGPDGTTSSGSVAVDVTEPESPVPGDPNEAMRLRSRSMRWGANRA
jgi:hypothetical protein